MRMFKKKVPKDAKLLVVNLTHLTGYNLGPKHGEVFVDVTVLRAGNYIPSRSGKIPRTEALPINCGASEIPFFKVFVWDIERSINPQEVTISVRIFKRRRPKWRRRYFGETYVECPAENEELCRSDTIEGRHPRRQPECEYYVCTFDVCLLESDFMTEDDPFFTPRSSLTSPLDDYLVGVNSQESPIAWDPVDSSHFLTRHWTDGGVTKAPSNYQLYDVVHVDLLKESRLPWPPPLNAHTTWDPESKVPRVVSIRLNYQQGHDLVQLAVMTHIRPEAIEALKGSPEHAGMLPALHLLRRLWEAKGQLPCEQPSSQASGVLKMIVDVDPSPDVSYIVKQCIHSFNAKPLVVQRETVFRQGEDWLEMDILGHKKFSYMTRSVLNRASHSRTRFAFLLQGSKEDELPEQLFCAFSLSGIDLKKARQLTISPSAQD